MKQHCRTKQQKLRAIDKPKQSQNQCVRSKIGIPVTSRHELW